MRAIARAVVVVGMGLGLAAPHSAYAAQDFLPAVLPDVSHSSEPPNRGWTIPDIVEVTRVTGMAIGDDHSVTFILKQPSIDGNRDRYGLYAMSADKPGSAHKLLEANYLAGLQRRPGSTEWTFLGDLGKGVQLYAVGNDGHPRDLVINSQLAPVGGYEGLVTSADEGERMTGVLAYGWAPDGSALWYSRLKLRSASEQQAVDDGGIFFNDAKMWRGIGTHAPDSAMTVELHVLNPASRSDRIVAAVPGDRQSAQQAFQNYSVSWVNPRKLAYRVITVTEDGHRDSSNWIVDAATLKATRETGRSFLETYNTISTPQGDLVLRRESEGARLVAMSADGKVKKNYGHVDFTRMGGDLGFWSDSTSGRAVVGVHYPDHDGLALFPSSSANHALAKISDQLDQCAFTSDLSLGVCNRENLTTAPELVAVDPANGKLTVLARPNARYDSIKPLHTVHARWTNRFGSFNDGYVTYPRGYQTGHRYPAIVVTHGTDAQNRFAYHGFQWEYPIQVLAEQGYFVLSVNEPRQDSAALNAYATGTTTVPVARMQREWGFKPVASMEAAAQSLVDQGMVDSDRIGIAGYSRGASVTTFALSLSKVFHAGIAGDADWFSAGGYWDGAAARGIYNGLFGGSPLDPRAFPNYLKFSPSARAAQFSGPLLQQFTSDTADSAIELDSALKMAGVPSELVFYRDETHLLHQPRHRAWAMRLGLQWFDYWLRDHRDPNPVDAQEYRRWEAVAKQWREPKEHNK